MVSRRKVKKSSTAGNFTIVFLMLITFVYIKRLNDISNTPNFAFLVLFTSLILLSVIFGLPRLIKNTPYVFTAIIGAWVIAFLLSLWASDNKYKGIFGEYGRLNGLITYFCVLVIATWSCMMINKNDYNRILWLLRISGLFQAIIGFFQFHDIKFFTYSNETLNIAGTFAQSNFLSAFLGISAVSFMPLLHGKQRSSIRNSLVLLAIGFQLTIIILSQSTQGIFAFALGFSLLVLLRIRDSKTRKAYLLVLTTASIIGFVGLLGRGPLATFVYQYSTALRGDYFRAALDMFKDNLIFGVGIDDFGGHYLSYRDKIAGLRENSDQVVTNYAHNDLLQFAATGGLILLVPYVLFNLFVLFKIASRFKETIRLSTNDDLDEWVIIVSWILFLLISQISVQKLSLLAWNAVITGIVVKQVVLSNKYEEPTRDGLVHSILMYLGILLVLITSLLVVRPRWTSERAIYYATKTTTDYKNQAFYDFLATNARKAISSQPNEPRYRILGIQTIYNSGFRDEAKEILRESLVMNPRNHYLWELKALIAREEGFAEVEIAARETIKQLNPYGKANNRRLEELRLRSKSN